MKSNAKEGPIQAAICDYLALKQRFFWRQNTGGMYDEKRMVRRALPKHALAGVPDIIVIYQSRFIGLEVKSPTGKLSEAQQDFERRCKYHGGEYYVVRSIDDVIKLGL